jgi:hypothetical protein
MGAVRYVKIVRDKEKFMQKVIDVGWAYIDEQMRVIMDDAATPQEKEAAKGRARGAAEILSMLLPAPLYDADAISREAYERWKGEA